MPPDAAGLEGKKPRTEPVRGLPVLDGGAS